MIAEFHEKQKFTQWWLWGLLVFIAILPFIISSSILDLPNSIEEQFSDSSTSLLVSLFVIFIIILFLTFTLKTDITKREIKMSFFPFIKKTIKWNEIKSAEVINYGFVGGWGIRLFTQYGTVYNIGGNKGLALELQNGKKLLIGTQKEEELRRFINEIRN